MFNRKKKVNESKTISAEQYEIVTKLEFKVTLENERQIDAFRNILDAAETYMFSRMDGAYSNYYEAEFKLMKEIKKVLDFTKE
jgi:hypothetical protein